MLEKAERSKRKKEPKKITPQRLKNIALYYLKRFDSSVQNLRQVLRRRVNDYAYYHPEWDKTEAYSWIENILTDFERYGYLDDARYAEIKVKNYAAAGKSARYIIGKLKQKGIGEAEVSAILEEQNYNPYEQALQFARKKKIGPFRKVEQRDAFKQKDMGAMLRAGFNYDIVQAVLARDV